jgi:undecaprenyl-diphosphatase
MSRPARSSWLSWLGAHEITVLLAIAGVAAGAWAFVGIAEEVVEGETRSFDETVLLAMRQPGTLAPVGPPVLQEMARDVTALGGVATLTLVTAITAGFLAMDGKGHMALFVCGSILSGVLVASILKDAFGRARPDLLPDPVYATGASFPSGHSMMSAVTYLTLGALLARSHERKRLKAYFLLVALGLTAAIGVTRVYLGVHWPTDVLAGWAAGAAWALLCWLTARRLQRRHTLEREAEHAPAP